MFDISALKNMKLSELQEIAKLAKSIKTTGVKKEALIQSILDQQGKSGQPETFDKPEETIGEKPKRARILPEKVTLENKVQKELFSSEIVDEIPAPVKPVSIAEKHLNKFTERNNYDISGLAKGIYFIRINNAITEKLIIE